MSTMIQFIANYDDLFTYKGHRFKFYCDKCRNGYMSRFQPNTIGIGVGRPLSRSLGPFLQNQLGAVIVQAQLQAYGVGVGVKEAADGRVETLHFTPGVGAAFGQGGQIEHPPAPAEHGR